MTDWISYWRLDFVDGRSEVVLPPTILGTPPGAAAPTMTARLLRAYHAELCKAIEGKRIWPLPTIGGLPDDSEFYATLAPWYRKIAQLLRPVFDPTDLDPLSRHQFFICTEPVTHPATDQQVRGLCGLEQLLGLAYAADSKPSTGPTTGDPDLDAIAYTLLTFKEADILPLAQTLSAADLSRMASYGNDLYRQASKEDKSTAPARTRDKAEAHDDDALFRENCDRILAKLRSLNIPVPPGFSGEAG